MKKLELIILVFVLFIIGFSNANAQKVSDKQKDRNISTNQLNLTDAQKEEFTKIRFANEEVKIKLKAELKMNKLEIKKLLNETNLDESKLLKLVESGNGLNSKLRKANVEMWLDIRNILDNDQKEIWKHHFIKMGKQNKMLTNTKVKNKKHGEKKFNRQSNRNKRFDRNNIEK